MLITRACPRVSCLIEHGMPSTVEGQWLEVGGWILHMLSTRCPLMLDVARAWHAGRTPRQYGAQAGRECRFDIRNQHGSIASASSLLKGLCNRDIKITCSQLQSFGADITCGTNKKILEYTPFSLLWVWESGGAAKLTALNKMLRRSFSYIADRMELR